MPNLVISALTSDTYLFCTFHHLLLLFIPIKYLIILYSTIFKSQMNFLKQKIKTLSELIKRVQIKKSKLKKFLLLLTLAERVGFEPTRRLPFYLFSRQAPSTTRPSLPFVIIFISSIFKKFLKYCLALILHYSTFYLCIVSKCFIGNGDIYYASAGAIF